MKNKASRALPLLDCAPVDLQILKQAAGLFAEALGRNNKALPNMNLAAFSLRNLQQKIDDLLLQINPVVEFDFNEAVIITASLNMYQVDVILFAPRDEDTGRLLKNCQSMLAYFTAIQGQPQPN